VKKFCRLFMAAVHKCTWFTVLREELLEVAEKIKVL
jgi:hypothetical protein